MTEETPHNDLPVPSGHHVSVNHLGDFGPAAKEVANKSFNLLGLIMGPRHAERAAESEVKVRAIKAEGKHQEALREVERKAELDWKKATVEWQLMEKMREFNTVKTIIVQAIEEIEADKQTPPLGDGESPKKMHDDWFAYFIKFCSPCSDPLMQSLWSRLLSVEAKSPGSISKRTVAFFATLDERDADFFSHFCRFAGRLDGIPQPFVFWVGQHFYANAGLTEDMLNHLSAIGLIIFSTFQMSGIPTDKDNMVFEYCRRRIAITLFDDVFTLGQGCAQFTRMGAELFGICEHMDTAPMPGFVEYVLEGWKSERRLEWSDIES